jgi:hypothetical protein
MPEVRFGEPALRAAPAGDPDIFRTEVDSPTASAPAEAQRRLSYPGPHPKSKTRGFCGNKDKKSRMVGNRILFGYQSSAVFSAIAS